MRRLGTALAALLLAGAGLTALAGSSATAGTAGGAGATTEAVTVAAARTRGCTHSWSSRPKISTDTDYAPLMHIRTGPHACFDRMVFDIGDLPGNPVGYRVAYVDELHQDGSGAVVPVSGGAVLEVRVAAPSHDPENGEVTYEGRAGAPLPGVDLSGYRTFRDVRYGGSFEGETQIGVGVPARLPFRVFQMGNHVVLDVAHRPRRLR